MPQFLAARSQMKWRTMPIICSFVVCSLHAGEELPLFIGYRGCVLVEQRSRLNADATLLILAAAQSPHKATVLEMRPWTGPARERPSQPDRDCSVFRSDVTDQGNITRVSHVARLSALPDDVDDVFFALGAVDPVILAGKPTVLGSSERRQFVDRIKPMLPDTWPPDRLLLHAFRYGPVNGHDIVQLSVGLPTLNAKGTDPPIARISVHRHYLLSGQPVGSETFERASGVPERAETEAPQLTYENWAESETELIVGFISVNRGRTWYRLITDLGFEGINWHVHELREGLPLVIRRFLYTPH